MLITMKTIAYFFGILGTSLVLGSEELKPIFAHVDPIKKIGTSDLPGARIIGGHEVEPNSAPYQVAVVPNREGLCGGSLISTIAVLTAAHCTIIASFVELRLGAHYYNREEPSQIRVTSTNVFVHEGYNTQTFENDISVVLLPSEVTLNEFIQVVPLALSTSPSYQDSSAYLTGWGLTEDFNLSPFLRGVNLTIISNAECSSFFSIVQDSTICTSGVGPVGGCSSDSGSPLVVEGVQVGVLSFGSGACVGGSPTGYARVSSFRDWIENIGL